MYVIAVQDLQESAAYYREVLGFSIREIGDDGWRMFERDGCQIMAGNCPDTIPARDSGDHSYFAYLVLGVRTNDGHRIMFGQEIT